jgi:hypothetical protein
LSLISNRHKIYGYEAYFLKSDIVSKLFEYCQTSLPDEESFKKIVRSKINNQSLYSIYKDIRAKSSYFLFFSNLSEASDTGSILLFAYSISLRKEEVCR